VTIPQAFELALQHHQAGRLAEAEALYRQILTVQPNHAEALHHLGVIAHQVGRNDVAVDLIRQAIALAPGLPETHSNLGEAYRVLGQLKEAIAAFRQAIKLKPNYPEAHSNLGNALRENGHLDEAVAACRQAVALQPDYPEAHSNLGAALYGKGHLDEAVAACRQAVALQPDYPEAYSNLGAALYGKGHLDAAIAAYRQAIALKPDYPEAHHHLALTLLLQGDFPGGWQEYEWRWKWKGFPSAQRSFGQSVWAGGPLEGRTLLLHAEQGFGDAIQFIRYLPLVAARGGKIILECQVELQRLFQTMAPDLPVLAEGQPLPDFDVHCPLVSLPRVFSTDLGSIPQTVPYLHADAAEVAIWRERLAGTSPSLKVGLVWAGRPSHRNDRYRSLQLANLASLAEVPGVRFISLQKDAAAAEARTPPAGMELIDVAEELKDFADTAALLANLDLIIAVDTAVVHLAGAMGRPVWTLLPFAPDWRWLLERSDSPWYPTLRLFRQPAPGDWNSVIRQLQSQLQLLVGSRRARP